PLPEDLHVTGAVHGLQREDAILGLRGEHVLAELLPMAGGLPQRAIDELRRPNLDIARSLEPRAEVAFQGAVERPALRVPEDAADRLFLLMEQVHLAAEPAMVTLLRFLELAEILLELF